MAQPISYVEDNTGVINWEFNNTTLNSISLAILSTILSYNLASIVFKICLGFKSRGRCKVHDLQAILIARDSSPLSVAASLFPIRSIVRAYYGSPIPEGVIQSRKETKIHSSVVFKLLVLLASIPIVNIIAVGITIEWTKEISVKDAKVSSIAHGISEKKNISERKISSDCVQFDYDTGPHDEPQVGFFRCSGVAFSDSTSDPNSALIHVRHLNDSFIIFAAGMKGTAIIRRYSLLMSSKNELHNVRLKYDADSINFLGEVGMELLAGKCGLEDYQQSVEDLLSEQTPPNYLFVRLMPCPGSKVLQDNEIEVILTEAISKMSTHLVPVPSDTFEIQKLERRDRGFSLVGDFLKADNIIFVRRKRRPISTFMLFIFVLVTTFCKLLLDAFLNEDHAIGVEIILKSRLGLHWFQSALGTPGNEQGVFDGSDQGSLVNYGPDSF